MSTSRWLNWRPSEPIFCESAGKEPTKPTKLGFDGFVGAVSQHTAETASVVEALKGHAIELWSDALGERFWLVANESDAARLAAPRSTIYTAAEAELVVKIADPSIVAEVHRWKTKFGGTVRGFERHQRSRS